MYVKNIIIGGMALLCLGAYANAEESEQSKAPVVAVNQLELHKKLLEINEKRKQAEQRRVSIIAKLRGVIRSFRNQGIIINKELAVLAETLSILEKRLDHKEKKL